MNWKAVVCMLPTALAPLNAQEYFKQQKVVVRVRYRPSCCKLHHVPDPGEVLEFCFGEMTKHSPPKTYKSYKVLKNYCQGALDPCKVYNPISFKQWSFWCAFLDAQLTTHHSNIGV